MAKTLQSVLIRVISGLLKKVPAKRVKFIMRILGIDYGEKYVGYAVSDAGNFISNPYKVVNIKNNKQFIEKTIKIVSETETEQIVIGLPVSVDGSEGPAAEKIKKLSGKLRNKLKFSVIEWDERYTTAGAEQLLNKADIKQRNHKKKIDKIAASLILQSYLDHINMKNG